MKLEPLADRVLIKPSTPPTQTKSGLLLSQHAKPEQVGTVTALGKLATKTGVQVGDTVLFSWQSGQELWIGDDGKERLLVMLEDDLLAVIGHGTSIEAEELIV